jgi:Sulfotransferase family
VQVTFVGGLDSSDTAAVAASAGAAAGWEALPVTLETHCSPRGLGDLLEGRITLAGFREAVGERWWADRLELVLTPQQLAETLDGLSAGYDTDPIGAARRFVVDLVTPFAERAGVEGVVEHSPANLLYAPILERLFPESRFVHAVRDGRESAIRHGGVRTAGELLAAVERWADGIRAIDAGVRVREDGASYGVWPDRMKVTALGPEETPGGGWRHGLTGREQKRVARRYARTLRELAEEKVHCAPQLLELRERAGG